MFDIWDYFNLIGIILQVIGFVLLLPRFMEWFKRKIQNLNKLVIDAFSNSIIGIRFILYQQGTMPKNQPIIRLRVRFFPPRIDITYQDETKLREYLDGLRDGSGIVTVILGLCFQFTAIILENYMT